MIIEYALKMKNPWLSRENIYSRLTTQNGLYHTVGVGHIPTAPVELVCHILKLKCTKFDFDWGSAPRPRWRSLQCSSMSPSWIEGGLLLRKGERKDGREGQGGGREGSEERGGEG